MPAEENVSNEVVVVVAGGAPPEPDAALAVPIDATVIAANGGLAHAKSLGLDVAEAVGDFDSASPETVQAAERAGVRMRRHPESKDASDLELALEAALERSPRRILVLAGVGDRVDHLLAAMLLLGSEKWAGTLVDAVVGRARVQVVRGRRELRGRVGETISLLPLGGRAEGVSTTGLEYELRDEPLEPGSSRGVSNVFTEDVARVSVERGVMLAIRPGSGATGAQDGGL
jgi:thiamine pyrophosphokinase